MLEREQFDLLHFHEPFVPFLSLVRAAPVDQRQRRDVPRLRRLLAGVRVRRRVLRRLRGRLHGRIAVCAAARHFIDRYFPGDYKVIPNGVDIAPLRRAVPIARWQDGTPNILFVGRLEPRKGLLDLLKAYRILRKTGCHCRLLVVGTGPQEREARRYVATRGLRGVEFLGRVSRRREGASCSRPPTSTSRRRPAASRSGSCCSRRWPPATAIVCSDIHGYKGVVRRGREGLLVPPREPKELAAAIARLLRDPDLREQMGAAGQARAEEFSWERVTAKVDDYYGFVIRRAGGPGPPAGGLPRRDPSGAAAASRAQAAGSPSSRARRGRPRPRRPAASGLGRAPSRHTQRRVGRRPGRSRPMATRQDRQAGLEQRRRRGAGRRC